MITNLSSFWLQTSQENAGIPPWLWLLIIIIVILLVWWLLTRSAREEPPHIEAHHEEHHEEPAPAEALTPPEAARLEPVALEAPPAPEVHLPDDLTRLEGIGPKVASVLNAASISTFAQLAAADLGKLKEILEAAGFRFMDPATWPEQAGLLAEGKLEEFEKLAASLKGGRRAE